MSCQAIAKLLNSEGVPCPTEYKKQQGEKYFSGWQKEMRVKWSPLTIRIILTNRVYLNILEQGKTYSINYKLKGRICKNPSDWICIADAHEAIISERTELDNLEVEHQILHNKQSLAFHDENEGQEQAGETIARYIEKIVMFGRNEFEVFKLVTDK